MMYRVNPLDRNVLITTDEVIKQAPTKQTLDPRMIESSIIIAEERFIRPLITYDYYEYLVAKKNTVVTSGNQAALQALLEESMGSLPEGVEYPQLEEGDIVNAIEFLKEDEDYADDVKLWNMFLWKIISECVMLLAYPEGFVQFGSEGVVHNQPASGPMNTSGIVTPELRSVKWAMDKKMMDRIDPMFESMHQWICKQRDADKNKYPEYDKECDCNAKGVAYKRKSDILLGIYDDEDEKTNCCE